MDVILKTASKRNMTSEMRNAGYFFLEEKTGPSFVRPMGRNGYPRFHIYMEKNMGKDEIIIKIHLDQKKPIYRGVSAHSGEYDGRVVETEAERIRKILG
jgi:hypothetical protein